jgi:FlaA1/EpsC-like NDP-sugar epimerase
MPHLRARHLFLMDVVAIATALALTLALWGESASPISWMTQSEAALLLLVVRPIVNVSFGMYRRNWRYASVGELLHISRTVVVGSLVASGLFLVLVELGLAVGTFSRVFWVLEGLTSLALLGGIRYAIRAAAERWRPKGTAARIGQLPGVPTILYGAGRAGVMVLRSTGDHRARIRPVGFLDDDDRLRGQTVAGLRVHGRLDELARLVEATGAQRLLITMPSATGATVRRIIDEATTLGVDVRTVPLFHEILDGSVDAYRIRRVKVEDLLRRPTVRDHQLGVERLVRGKAVMITGAGGSIGSELARQVFSLRPSRLVLVDRAEGSLYGVQREIEVLRKRTGGTGELSAHIANVASRLTMHRLIRDSRPNIIFHAAAYKHVPMMEEHPSDAIHVNVGGTMSVLEAAEANAVPHVVFVSTDKAVHPSSVMGATKRVAEALVGEAARRSGNCFVSVRFGNVLGSSGSVVPIFQQQLERGEPLTVTHPDMTRYFMTIPEAVWLILDAAAIGDPGSLLVLDMGEPVRIVDLASDLIRLSGRDPESVPIEFTGLRPGEKLHEELFYATEQMQPTRSEKVMLAAAQAVPDDIRERAATLISLADGDHDAALRMGLFELTDRLEATAAGRPPRARSSAPALASRSRRQVISVSAPEPSLTGPAS